MGPFEEEEEGTIIASDVVKVEGAESGHPRSPDLRNDTGTAISPISGQQSKATHPAYKNFNNVVVMSNSFVDRVHRNRKPPKKNISLQNLKVLFLM